MGQKDVRRKQNKDNFFKLDSYGKLTKQGRINRRRYIALYGTMLDTFEMQGFKTTYA